MDLTSGGSISLLLHGSHGWWQHVSATAWISRVVAASLWISLVAAASQYYETVIDLGNFTSLIPGQTVKVRFSMVRTSPLHGELSSATHCGSNYRCSKASDQSLLQTMTSAAEDPIDCQLLNMPFEALTQWNNTSAAWSNRANAWDRSASSWIPSSVRNALATLGVANVRGRCITCKNLDSISHLFLFEEIYNKNKNNPAIIPS